MRHMKKFTSSQENTNQSKHKIIRYNQQLKNLKRALTSAGDRGIGKAYSFTGNNMKIYNFFGKESGNTYKILKFHLSYDLAIPLLGFNAIKMLV